MWMDEFRGTVDALNDLLVKNALSGVRAQQPQRMQPERQTRRHPSEALQREALPRELINKWAVQGRRDASDGGCLLALTPRWTSAPYFGDCGFIGSSAAPGGQGFVTTLAMNQSEKSSALMTR